MQMQVQMRTILQIPPKVDTREHRQTRFRAGKDFLQNNTTQTLKAGATTAIENVHAGVLLADDL